MTPARPTDVPSAGQVVDLFQRALRQTEPDVVDGVLQLLLDLHRNNLDQWRCEDTTRGVDVSDATVAAAKRAIDAHNATRHVLVEAIDAALAAAVEQDPSATPATESPAMVFDRLSVLTIRIHVTEAAAGRDQLDRPPAPPHGSAHDPATSTRRSVRRHPRRTQALRAVSEPQALRRRSATGSVHSRYPPRLKP